MRVLGGTLALLLAAGKVRCAFRFCWLRVSCEALVRGGNWHIGEMSDEGREMDAALALPCGSVEKIDGVMEWGSLEGRTRLCWEMLASKMREMVECFLSTSCAVEGGPSRPVSFRPQCKWNAIEFCIPRPNPSPKRDQIHTSQGRINNFPHTWH